MSNHFGKTFDEAPEFTRRRRIAGAALVLVCAGVAYAGVLGFDTVAGGTPNQMPTITPEGDYKTYTVHQGDTIGGIVQRAYPKIELYHDEFNAKVAQLKEQIADTSAQYRGIIVPNQVLRLPEDAAIGDLVHQETSH